ncbi:TonB-dependent hemoglobin/transferrin/lactoferrin family receptor [[Haemophilus] felis]|nr:TonB-dependent hemoglobin/transferrin/lactoferrin family receptor [[Haemophilus] felis]
MKRSKLSLAILLAFPALAMAKTPVSLDEIEVVALRDSSQFAQLSHNTVNVGKNRLQQLQATSTADALKNIAGVDIEGGSRAVAQKPTIRGLGGQRVVQVIDGVRQNFYLGHRGSYFLPLSLTQEVEVVKGPSSSLWGSGALGGVVAMRTPNALDLLKNNDKFGVKVRQGYQSANNLSESEVSVFGANDKFDALVAGFYNKSNNLRLGDGQKLPHSGSTQKGGLIKFGWQINDEHRVELSHRVGLIEFVAPGNNEAINELTTQDILAEIGKFHSQGRSRGNGPSAPSGTVSSPTSHTAAGASASSSTQPHSVPTNAATRPVAGGQPNPFSSFYEGIMKKFGTSSYLSEQKINDQSTVLNYYLNPENNPYLNTQFTLFRNHTVEKEKRVKSGLQDKTQLSSLGFSLRNSSDFGKVYLTYGVDYVKDSAKNVRGTNDNANEGKYRPASYSATAETAGGYLLAHFAFLNERLVFSPSVRYDQYQTKSQGTAYKSNHLSPSASLTWKATDYLEFNARYNEAFRAPSMQERFTSGSHFGFQGPSMGQNGVAGTGASPTDTVNTFKINPNLKPETAKNKEISATFKVNNLMTAQDQLRLNATYFQNDIKQFIQLQIFKAQASDSIPNVSQYQNVVNARLNGLELSAHYQTERLQLNAIYAQTRGQDKSSKEALQGIAADKLGFGINYELVKDKFNLGANITHYGTQKRVPKGFEHYKGYTLTNLHATYAPLKGEWENLRIDFAIENLFDKKYQPAFSLMQGSGRNVKLSVGYTF